MSPRSVGAARFVAFLTTGGRDEPDRGPGDARAHTADGPTPLKAILRQVLSRRQVLGVVCAALGCLAGCGGGMTVSFTRTPHTVHLRVGQELGVRKSRGECGSPWSSMPSVIAVEHPPRQDDCSADTVTFRAKRPGEAQIHGALPCQVPACAGMGAIVPVAVSRA